MLEKRQVRLRELFCPLASTPAVNLLRDFPKRQGNDPQTVEVLSLEWGDPRDILFSLHQEGLGSQTKFNFTCSDHEPAILARNVFLLTLIADAFDAVGSKDDIVALAWRLSFHLAIPQEDMFFVECKANNLIEYSRTLQSWESCPYGNWIHFHDSDTLRSVHHHFIDFAAPSLSYVMLRGCDVLQALNKIRAGGHIVQGILAAGFHAARSVTTMSVALEGFWKTGVVAGNQQDKDELDKYARKGGITNPLFAISLETLSNRSVPWGMDPLTGFHLASAFDEIDDCTTSAIEKVVDVAKAQFRDWSQTFAAFVKTRRVELRLYHGDAVRFCYSLQAGNPLVPAPPEFTYIYKNSWSSVPTPPSPEWKNNVPFFDVIDTANVADQAGMLILLPAVVPLLRRAPSSILYTESLLRPHKGLKTFNMHSSLRKVLCTEPEFLSFLFGIAPSQYLTGISADSFVPETTIWDLNQLFQYRLRIPWRIITDSERYMFPTGGRTCSPTFLMNELPNYLGKLYESMFKLEIRGDSLTFMVSMIEEEYAAVPGDQRYYTRNSFALLLHFIKSYVDVDWNKVLSLLLKKIQDLDSTSLSEQRLQELQLAFHTVGLLDAELLKVPPRNLGDPPYDMYAPNDKDTGLLGQTDVPPIVYITLVVPRSNLDFFTQDKSGNVATLPLHVAVVHSLGERNEFHSLQYFFGELSETEDNGICRVEEERVGGRGDADLIVVCQVPLFTLLHGPREGVTVSLDFDPIPPTEHFLLKLGGKNTVFKTGLSDQKRLHILREPPTTAGNLDSVRSLAVPRTPAPPEEREKALIILSGDSASKHLEVKVFLPPESPAAQEIARNPTITTTISVDTFLSVSVFVGDCDPIFVHLPYPVFAGPTEARTFKEGSRSGVMLVSHTAYPGIGGCPIKGDFPVHRDASGNLFPWTLPRVALHAAPKIAKSDTMSKWVKSFSQRCMAHEEGMETLKRTTGPPGQSLPCPTPSTLLKMSITRIVNAFAQPGIANPTIHFVRTIPGATAHLAIVGAGVRHDPSTSSLVIDAYVLPLTREPIMKAMSRFKQVHAGPCGVIGPSHDAIIHQYLICSAERCRTWEHSSTCAYGTSSPFGEPGTPAARKLYPDMCQCGEGKMLEDFPRGTQYWVAKQYATRVAMPLLFGVPYVEAIDTHGTTLWAEIERMNDEEERVEQGRCVHCGTKKENLKRCARCKYVMYCDSACQKAHWKVHKKSCHEKADA